MTQYFSEYFLMAQKESHNTKKKKPDEKSKENVRRKQKNTDHIGGRIYALP